MESESLTAESDSQLNELTQAIDGRLLNGLVARNQRYIDRPVERKLYMGIINFRPPLLYVILLDCLREIAVEIQVDFHSGQPKRFGALKRLGNGY